MTEQEEHELAQRARDLTSALRQLQATGQMLRSQRQEVLRELNGLGFSYLQIGQLIGISAPRVGQILRAGTVPTTKEPSELKL